MTAWYARLMSEKGWCLAALMVLTGAFGALALPPVNAFFVLPVAFIIFYHAVSQAPNWRKAAWWGFLFGMGFHTAGLYWLTNAILTRIHEFWWMLPFAAPGAALIIAPLMAVSAVVCRLVRPGWPRIVLFAGSWTLADMSRTLLFSGFPWNPLGSALELPGLVGDILIQPARWIGVDGLSLVLVLASVAIWQGWRAVFVVLAGAILWCGWGTWRVFHPTLLEVKNPSVVLVQGNVPEEEVVGRMNTLERFESYLRATERGVYQARQAGKEGPLVVVWPESAFPGILNEDDLARQRIAWAANGATAFIGSPRREGGKWYNSLEAIGRNGKIEAYYDKSRLVPFGEYQPKILPFNLVPFVFTPGPGLKTWDSPDFGRVGPMICYEIIFSGAVVAPHDRPDWLLTISNDAWYGNSAGPRQHLATGRMRAVEEGLPVVFINNRGVSAVYDARGHEQARTGWGKEQLLITTLPAPEAPTIFAQWGRGIALFLSLSLMVLGFSARFFSCCRRFMV